MKQGSDRNYAFVVSSSNQHLIRVRRIKINKVLTHTCAGLVIFSWGVFAYSFIQKSVRPQIVQASNQPLNINNLSSDISERKAPDGHQGEPADISEIIVPKTYFEVNKIEMVEQIVSDKDFKPSIFPLAGKINDNFGFRRNPFNGSVSEFHPGLDIHGEKGDSVVAPANGVVVKAGRIGGYGNMVEIDHGNELTTRYGHLSQINVEIGEEIKRGQEIGKVGSTGRSTGPHLHYEVRAEGQAINPRLFLPPDDPLVAAAAAQSK